MMEFFETYTVGKIFLCLIVSVIFIKFCWEVFSWVLEKLNMYHAKKKLSEVLDERINNLEKHDKRQYEQIDEISKGMIDIQETLATMKKENDERTITSFRTELYHMHGVFMKQGYVTREGLETFSSMADIYIACGGNHVCKSKLIPEVMNLPIHEITEVLPRL